MSALLIAGICFVLAGFLAIIFGIPVKEFSFGNTMIVAGASAVGAGAILIGLSQVVRELRAMSDQIAGAALNPQGRRATSDGAEAFPFNLNPPAKSSETLADRADEPPAAAGASARLAPDAPETAPADPDEATAPKKRNLLFSSISRKERERKAARNGDPGPDLPPPLPASSEALGSEIVPRPSFDEAWPQSERARPDTARRAARPAEPLAARPEPPTPDATIATPAGVTVLKSGVVDGMAYSLFSDGSIEAQLPEGTMRFASIDDLRSHLDQRT